MKKLTVITSVLFLFAFSLQAQIELSEDYSFQTDKQYHVIAGGLISGTVFTVVCSKTKDESLAMRAGWMSACMAGLTKEMFDGIQGKEVSISDLLYTTLSGIAVGYLAKGIVKVKKKRQAKKNEQIYFSLESEIFKTKQ